VVPSGGPVGGSPSSAPCPLYPQKQTLIERVGMSAKCQKRTFCAAARNVAIRSPRQPAVADARARRGRAPSDDAEYASQNFFAVLNLGPNRRYDDGHCSGKGDAKSESAAIVYTTVPPDDIRVSGAGNHDGNKTDTRSIVATQRVWR
jgi:hypothetical protein